MDRVSFTRGTDGMACRHYSRCRRPCPWPRGLTSPAPCRNLHPNRAATRGEEKGSVTINEHMLQFAGRDVVQWEPGEPIPDPATAMPRIALTWEEEDNAAW